MKNMLEYWNNKIIILINVCNIKGLKNEKLGKELIKKKKRNCCWCVEFFLDQTYK